MPIKECTLPEGGKGWQWGDRGKCYASREDAEKQAEAARANGYVGDALSFDRSARIIDVDGRMHVAMSNISKATVNPYYGREIPCWEELQLSPDHIYNLLRDPGELDKAAGTFNNLPLLSIHKAVSADKPEKDLVVGSTGTDAEFSAPYLRNSLVIWDAAAIAGIESRDQCEISCAYRYKPVMTPGVYEGMAYDGVMTEIIGNHVALVEVGRAGPDVVVADAALAGPFLKGKTMPKANRKTVAVRAALKAYLRPMLAQDAQLDINKLVGEVKAATLAKDAQRIARDVLKHAKFAADKAKDEDVEDVVKSAAEEEAEDEDDEYGDVEYADTKNKKYPLDTEEHIRAAWDYIHKEKDADKYSAEERAAIEKRIVAAWKEKIDKSGPPEAKAEDDDTDGKKKMEKSEMDKKAMDAAIKQGEANAIKRLQAIHQAEKDVQPIIGEVGAMDSAEAVYKMALDHLGVDVDGVHPSAYAAMVKLATAKAKPALAQDSAGHGKFWDQFSKNIVLPTRA